MPTLSLLGSSHFEQVGFEVSGSGYRVEQGSESIPSHDVVRVIAQNDIRSQWGLQRNSQKLVTEAPKEDYIAIKLRCSSFRSHPRCPRSLPVQGLQERCLRRPFRVRLGGVYATIRNIRVQPSKPLGTPKLRPFEPLPESFQKLRAANTNRQELRYPDKDL